MFEHMRKLPEKALVLVLAGSLIVVFGIAFVRAGVQFVHQKIAAVSAPAASAPAHPAPPAVRPAARVATTTPAAASTPVALPTPPPTPPAGVQAGWITEQTLGRDAYGQWLTLSSKTLQQASLNLVTPAAPDGAQGSRRTFWTAWIKTTRAAQTVTLHVVGGSASVEATVAGQKIAIEHSNAWSSAPTSRQTVANMQPGWHRVTITVDRDGGASGQVLTELQLGSADVDPVVPVPWQLPETSAASQPAPASTAAKPAIAGSENHGR